MSKITRPMLKTLRVEIDAALKEVLEKHGLSGSIGNIKFDDSSFRTTLTVNAGDVSDAAEAEFKKHCKFFGLEASDFGREFTSNGRKFTVCGIKPRALKYPILAVDARGSKYKFHASAIK